MVFFVRSTKLGFWFFSTC